MSAKTQLSFIDNAGNPLATPDQRELVTRQILWISGLNAQAFSGAQNPSTIYRLMVDGSPSVFPYYREVEEKDTAIASAIETRKILARARDAKVQGADPDNGEAKRYAEGLAEFLEAIPNFRQARRELLAAPAYGYKVLEILWSVAPEGIRAKLIGRPQEIFRFGRLTEPQIGELLLSSFPGGEGAPVPASKFIVATHQPRDGDRRGLPLLRRLFWPSWFKRNVLRLHLGFLEKGNGTVVVKYNPGASDTEKDKALAAARAIALELATAVPEGFALVTEALQTTRTRDANDFRALFDYFDMEMTRLILGQTLSTRGQEQGVGTQALGAVHQALLWEYIADDLADEEEAWNEQLCAPWLLWTYGPRALERDVRPYWRVAKQPPKDRMAELSLLEKARNLGARVPELEVYEKGGIRQADAGEAVLPPPALSMAMLPEELPEVSG